MTSKLPDKPSELIRAGLEDLDKLEKLPEIYEVNMDVFHVPSIDTRLCGVCFAGGMMAMRLGVKPTELAVPEHSRFSEEEMGKLEALNYLRSGEVMLACYCLDVDLPLQNLRPEYYITPYRKDPTAFKADMRDLADTLEGAGL